MFKNISHVSVSESNLLCHCLSYEENCGVAGDRKEKRRIMFTCGVEDAEILEMI